MQPSPFSRERFRILRQLRICLLLYILLLIFEGSIRKWLLPQLSGPLLLVRDPVALYSVFLGIRLGSFTKRIGLQWYAAVASIITIGALIGFLLSNSLPPLLYLIGLRTYFLHLPLIWLFADAFNRLDCERIGKWFLMFSPLMAALMMLQYFGKRTDWINLGAGGGEQISANIGDKIRAAGTFSYNSGAGYYFALVVAFAVAHLLMSSSRRIDYLALVSAVVAASVSISRSTVFMLLIVACLPVILVPGRIKVLSNLVRRQLATLVLIVLVVMISPINAVISEGLANFETRRVSAANADGGFMARTFILFDIRNQLYQAPAFGQGIGLGTNAAAFVLSGRQQFLLEEWDWPRHISELGPVMGLLFIGIRVSITFWLLRLSVLSSRMGDMLPFALWCALLPILLAGNIAVPMHMGFVVVIAGLLLASLNKKIVLLARCSI